MKQYEFEIAGKKVVLNFDELLDISDVMISLSKQLNGDVDVEKCIYKGKKKFYQEIKIDEKD